MASQPARTQSTRAAVAAATTPATPQPIVRFTVGGAELPCLGVVGPVEEPPELVVGERRAELVERVRKALAETLDPPDGTGSEGDLLGRLNAALDAFESELRSIVGPRVASLDTATGAVTMEHRSEAGQPLRAFGGQ